MRRAVGWIAFSLSVAFGLILINQVLQLADFASRVNPTAGQGVFWGLLILLGTAFSVPVVLLFRLPAPLVPPADDHGPEFQAHLEHLRRRLQANPMTRGRPLDGAEEIEAALEVLDHEALERIRQAGNRAFLTTAVSQNGALDALVVFGIQARLVWEVATTYSQRPGLRELSYLYSNVLTTAFIAGELEDADVAEAMEPALSAVLGSAAGLVPGLQVASNVFVSSVLTGTANAFMTLRTGVIAQEYSRAWTRRPRRRMRTLAVTRAGTLLGGIVLSGATSVSGAISKGAGRAITGAVTGSGRAVKGAVSGTGKAVGGVVTGTGKRIGAAGAAIRERFRSEGDAEDEPDRADGSS